MKNLITITVKTLPALVGLLIVTGCISVKREDNDPDATVTTTRSTSVGPVSTTRVERTTTY